MKKKISIMLGSLFFLTLIFFACSKQSEGSGVVPTYKGSATSTGNNPNVPHTT